MKKLLLIDGNSMLFRAYYSTMGQGSRSKRLSTRDGIPTSAVYSFILMLNKAMDLVKPDCMLVAWDAGKATFRHEQFPEYKGKRPPVDEELIVQMPIVREYLDKAKITRYEQEGYEADDIIGTMARSAPDMQTYILTSDKDLWQLIDPSTKVLMMKKGLTDMDIMDEKAVEEKWGITPAQVVDLKGLMGDPSDNIPGVRGVGEKTALKLLHQFGSVDGVYEHIDEVKGKMKEKLEDGHDQALLSRELARIYTQMELPFDLQDLEFKGEDIAINEFYQKYEMRSLIHDRKPEPEAEELPVVTLETFDLADTSNLLLIPVCDSQPFLKQRLDGFFIPLKTSMLWLPLDVAKNDLSFLQMLQEEDTLRTWNVKDTMHLLDRHGFPVPAFKDDLHLQDFLLHSQATNEDALFEALGLRLPFPYRDMDKKSLGGASEERLFSFWKAAAAGLSELGDELDKQLKAQNLEKLYREVEMPLVPILYSMEKEGIRIDAEKLAELGRQYEEILNRLANEIYELAGTSFNLGSPKQLAEVLFDRLGLKQIKKRSTAVEVLEALEEEHPIIKKILEYRKYAKLQTTYVEGLTKHIVDGRIHSTFNQTMTQTGRLSSSDPNLQNISVKTEEGRKIRGVFEADPGHKLISADYSQIELRVLAHMANEEIMLDTFRQGIDIHIKTASEIFDVPPEEVTESQRRTAKTVNFGIIYGQTDFGLSQELHIGRREARKFMDMYFASYPNIHRYMNEVIAFCQEHGYVETLLHRRREIPEIKDKNYMTREFGKRAAMNAPIQGTAADLIKLAMIKMCQAIQEKGLKSRLLLQIHDELIFDVPEDEIDIMMKLVPDVMDHAMELNVPLETSVHCGKTWEEAK